MNARETPSYHAAVTKHLSAVLRSERAATDYILSSFNPDELGYRVINKDALTSGGCVLDIGLFSRGEGSGPVWQRERFREHCAGRVMHPPSPYLSISTSPRRVLNILPTRGRDAEVAVIDMKMLRIMNPHHRSTTDIAAEFGLKSGTYEEGCAPYVTETHFLVYEYIHQSCLMGFISAADFEQTCREHDIGTVNDAGYNKTLRWLSLKPRRRLQSTFSTDPDFMHTSLPLPQPRPVQPMPPPRPTYEALYGTPAYPPPPPPPQSSYPPYKPQSNIDDLTNGMSNLGLSKPIPRAPYVPNQQSQAQYAPQQNYQRTYADSRPAYGQLGPSYSYQAILQNDSLRRQASQWHPQSATYSNQN